MNLLTTYNKLMKTKEILVDLSTEHKPIKNFYEYLQKTSTVTKLEHLHELILITPALISSLCYGLYHIKSLKAGKLNIMSEPFEFEWNHNGVLHREDGPAKIHFLEVTKEYYFNGQLVDADDTPEFKKKIKMKAFW